MPLLATIKDRVQVKIEIKIEIEIEIEKIDCNCDCNRTILTIAHQLVPIVIQLMLLML